MSVNCSYMEASFKDQIVILANKFRSELGTPPSRDVHDSAVGVLTHMVTRAMCEVNHIPVANLLSASDATTGMVFLCFLGSAITIYLEREAVHVPINELMTEAGAHVFPTFNKDEMVRIISDGLGEYQSMASRTDDSSVRKFSNAIDGLVRIYVMSHDERCIAVFGKLYLALLNAKQAQRS